MMSNMKTESYFSIAQINKLVVRLVLTRFLFHMYHRTLKNFACCKIYFEILEKKRGFALFLYKICKMCKTPMEE